MSVKKVNEAKAVYLTALELLESVISADVGAIITIETKDGPIRVQKISVEGKK